MRDTFEDMAISLAIELDAVASHTAIDVDAFIKQMRNSGMTDKEIIAVLQDDLAIGGRIFGQFKNGLKNTVKTGVTMAANTAARKIFLDAGVEVYEWQTSGSGSCPDCIPRHGLKGTWEEFEAIGLPKSGFSVCGMHCNCVIVPQGKATAEPINR